jgi:hypothetical protein
MNSVIIFFIEDDPFFGEAFKFHLKLNQDFDAHLFKTGIEYNINLYLKPDIIGLGLEDPT